MNVFKPTYLLVFGAVVAFGFSGLDAFVFHQWGVGVDLSLLWAGLGALGITGAYVTGVGVPTPPK